MSTVIDEILGKIQALEQDLEQEYETQRTQFRYRLDQHKVLFEQEMTIRHRALRKSVMKFWRESELLNFITSPVIYALVVPLVLLDLSLSLFQLICFPIYGIKKVPRSDFIVIDRHHLAYLNWVEKLNCAYCGYANGVIAYGREIASRTEKRWCPIKHARRVRGVHHRYYEFDDYGDAESYREHMNNRR
ncbi:hypothetical protein [Magnetovibrio sp.]|uniref:hypothetical protein n=1 Tax=Magnetovibrio sp. TaxID=2024836 RepID=UPI002F91D489